MQRERLVCCFAGPPINTFVRRSLVRTQRVRMQHRTPHSAARQKYLYEAHGLAEQSLMFMLRLGDAVRLRYRVRAVAAAARSTCQPA